MALNVSNLEGNELADYIRKSIPQGRWGDTWDIFKTNFTKLILINIFILITLIPGIAIILVRNVYVLGIGASYPFNANVGVGYPIYTDIAGLAENVYLTADLMFYSLLIVAGFIASVGIAGGAYSIRKIINTRGEFNIKTFFRGIKVCYFNTVLPVTVFMIFFFGCKIVSDWKNFAIATGQPAAGPITAVVFMIIATVLVGIICAWIFAVGVSYKVKMKHLLKNSFVLLIGSPFHTVLFAGIALVPVWLFLIGSFFTMISYAVFIFIGFSFILLVWLAFTQWVFDIYVAPAVAAETEAAKAKKSPKELAADKQEDDKRVARELVAAGRSELIGKPIKPVEASSVKKLGATFSRADLAGVETARGKLVKDVADYEKEHKNDPLYAEYNKLFAERERALQSDGKKGKKKISRDGLLK